MEGIINFVNNNYSWFLTISIILVLALIGYIYDTKRNRNDLLRKTEEEIDEEAFENITVQNDKGLAESVRVSKNINVETKEVELTDKSILEDNNKN